MNFTNWYGYNTDSVQKSKAYANKYTKIIKIHKFFQIIPNFSAVLDHTDCSEHPQCTDNFIRREYCCAHQTVVSPDGKFNLFPWTLINE